MPDFYDMDGISDDDVKLQETKVESLRSVVVPAIHVDNSPCYAAQNYAARMQAEKDSVTDADVLNTTLSSACNYVKPKKNRGERKTKDEISGSDAIIIALKHKVRSMQ
jgi:uncharacterized cysteine cluster protein YcgN (CxxCxxCC family)